MPIMPKPLPKWQPGIWSVGAVSNVMLPEGTQVRTAIGVFDQDAEILIAAFYSMARMFNCFDHHKMIYVGSSDNEMRTLYIVDLIVQTLLKKEFRTSF